MDRQDIDALLIGALYGELTPADEARLTAHLDSHPADRGALDDLKTARQAVRESRIFELQLDPPQAVSALLLQEAHRRAPKRVATTEEKEGWFARFARSFMAHPAMAAAAMLVLVVGVAGTLYLKKGGDFAARTAPTSELENESAPSAPTTIAQTPVPEPTAGAAGSATPEGADQAAMADGEGYKAGLYEGKAEAVPEPADKVGRVRADEKRQRETPLAKERSELRREEQKLAATPVRKNKGIAVSTEQPQPKDLVESDRSKQDASGSKTLAFDTGSTAAPGATRGAGGGGAATGTVAPASPSAGPYAQPPPPAQIASGDDMKSAPAKPRPDPKPQTKAPAAKAEPPKVTIAKPPAEAPAPAAPAPPPSRDESALVAWAKGQHQRTIALVKAGKCVDAAKIALGVSNRAPDYYSQFMATDRALNGCRTYINAERDKDAEKSAKSRAQKRVNADEAAPATNAK
jgi:hypothetical protein